MCKAGWFYVTSHGCYIIFEEEKLFSQAEQLCVEEEGRLAAWETQEEFEAVRDMLATILCKLKISKFPLTSRVPFY